MEAFPAALAITFLVSGGFLVLRVLAKRRDLQDEAAIRIAVSIGAGMVAAGLGLGAMVIW